MVVDGGKQQGNVYSLSVFMNERQCGWMWHWALCVSGCGTCWSGVAWEVEIIIIMEVDASSVRVLHTRWQMARFSCFFQCCSEAL